MSLLVQRAFASLPENTTHRFTLASSSHDVKDDATSMLWEALKRLLFVSVMSLQGFITNIIHSSRLRNGTSLTLLNLIGDAPTLAALNLNILENLTFISTRFGYSAFDEWNFVYLASIDLLSPFADQVSSFLQSRIPGAHSQSSPFSKY